MTQRHKHADLIIAWANGSKIQYLNKAHKDWRDCPDPGWLENYDYRIKLEPKPDVRVALVLRVTNSWRHTQVQVQWQHGVDCDARPLGYQHHHPDLILTYDGETGKLKAAQVV